MAGHTVIHAERRGGHARRGLLLRADMLGITVKPVASQEDLYSASVKSRRVGRQTFLLPVNNITSKERRFRLKPWRFWNRLFLSLNRSHRRVRSSADGRAMSPARSPRRTPFVIGGKRCNASESLSG